MRPLRLTSPAKPTARFSANPSMIANDVGGFVIPQRPIKNARVDSSVLVWSSLERDSKPFHGHQGFHSLHVVRVQTWIGLRRHRQIAPGLGPT